MVTAIKRRHERQRMVGDLPNAEINQGAGALDQAKLTIARAQRSGTRETTLLAEGVGFEPTVPLRARRFSRPVP